MPPPPGSGRLQESGPHGSGDDGRVCRPLHVRRTGMVYSHRDLSLWAFGNVFRNTTGSSSDGGSAGPWWASSAGHSQGSGRRNSQAHYQKCWPTFRRPAPRRPQDHGDAALSAGHVADLGSLVEQGFTHLRSEVIVHQLTTGRSPTLQRPRPCPQTLLGDKCQ